MLPGSSSNGPAHGRNNGNDEETRKRKAANLDEILSAKRVVKTAELKIRFDQEVMSVRSQWLLCQKRASLLAQPQRIDTDNHPMKIFGSFFRQVSMTPTYPDDHLEQIKLIQDVIKESIIIEWPKPVRGLFGDEEQFDDVDQAPVIHRARNVVKCRTSHPTMRVKVFAIEETGRSGSEPRVVEAFFRATLVKAPRDANDPVQMAGRLILTQREGTPATKQTSQAGAAVSKDGRLVASQALDSHCRILAEEFRESVKTTSLKFENGTLCATFPEMGVTLNSMVDRRQLSTRYTIMVEVALNIDNKLIVRHTVNSHPFLIAITNDQTECLMQAIFWDRLEDDTERNPRTLPTSPTGLRSKTVKWGLLKEAAKNFMKAQSPAARALDDFELLHVQAMLFLKKGLKMDKIGKLAELEMDLYGHCLSSEEDVPILVFRDRLLREFANDDYEVTQDEFMTERSYSTMYPNLDIGHPVWMWLYRIAEMIVDVGHKLTPAPVIVDKRTDKNGGGQKTTKKQLGPSAEYETMLTLFNKRFLTLMGPMQSYRIMTSLSQRAMMMRFCDENAGHISFTYNSQNGTDQMIMGSLSNEQIKDFKQGLPEIIIDEKLPKQYEYMIKMENANYVPTLKEISKIFKSYMSLRLHNQSLIVPDDENYRRLNPATGEKIVPSGNANERPSNPFEQQDDDEATAAALQQILPGFPLHLLENQQAQMIQLLDQIRTDNALAGGSSDNIPSALRAVLDATSFLPKQEPQ